MNHAHGFVLLQEDCFDPTAFLNTLQQEWGIVPDKDEPVETDGNGALSFNADGLFCSIAPMPAPIPNGEAERSAALNYYWPEAAATAARHQAHLLVVVMPLAKTDSEVSPIEIMSLYSKLACTALADGNALGIYTSGTVFAPDFYRSVCNTLHRSDLPIPAWIFIGLYTGENGNNAYTIGLRQFGKTEMEILHSQHRPGELLDTLYAICGYVIGQNIQLQDGETIGSSETQKLAITRSPAVAGIAEETLKIAF